MTSPTWTPAPATPRLRVDGASAMLPGRSRCLSSRLGTIGACVTTIGAALTIFGTFRGWVASGARHRNSYDILQLVDRLGFAPDGPLYIALRAWPLVPLLVVTASVAAWWRWHAVATVCGLAGGAYAGGVGVVVGRGPRDGVVRVLDGPQVTAVGAMIVVLGATVVAVAGASRLYVTRWGVRTTRRDLPAPASGSEAGP